MDTSAKQRTEEGRFQSSQGRLPWQSLRKEGFYRLISMIAVMLVILNAASLVSALEPPSRAELDSYIQDGTLKEKIIKAKDIGNHKVSPHLVKRAKNRLRKIRMERQMQQDQPLSEGKVFAPPPAWKGMPSTGTVNILTLLIAFEDYPASNSSASISSKLFGNGDGWDSYPYESLHNFYDRSSYGQLNIQGNVLGWYRAPYTRSSVIQTRNGRENLIKEALNYYNSQGHDFSQYDNDGDGAVDYFAVIWTGPDNGWANFWWAYQTGFSDSTYTLDGKTLYTYSWQYEARPYPGEFSPKTLIHETGHALGLPDYYDYDESQGPGGGVGGLDMMDANWGDHNCFSKFLLDWIAPETISEGSRTVTLRASGSAPDCFIVMPDINEGDQFDEFFVVQHRSPVYNDKEHPADGLLIWHVDSRLNASGTDYLYDNSYTDHKLLRLMEADGLEEIENVQGAWADAGDYYTPGDIFGSGTQPNSRRYDGSCSGISVTNMASYGETMTATISLDAECGPGTPCGIGKVYDCAGGCVDQEKAQSWIGDGYCDDGTYGMDLRCPEFRNDEGDCGFEETVPGTPCGIGKVYDCAGICVDEEEAETWIGDGYCDDGTYGMDLRCPEFNNDDNDCGESDSDNDGFPDGDGTNPCTGGNTVNCDDNCPDSYNPNQADVDSDGVGDICDHPVAQGPASTGVFRSGWWYLDTNGTGGWNEGDTKVKFGIAGDIPVTGDWDGDGHTDMGIYRDGRWYLDSNGTPGWNDGDTELRFGIAGDMPVTGDWDGDGLTDIGIYRGGWWYLDSNGTPGWNEGDIRIKLGIAGDMPVTGDWDGDGLTDIGIYRGGWWYLDSNGTPGWNYGDTQVKFGTSGDIAVIGIW